MNSDEFSCIVCLEICDNAVETVCCSHLLCHSCTQNMNDCPMCRKNPFRTNPSRAVRRMIGKLEVPCPKCNALVQRCNLKDHESVCTVLEYQCISLGCRFKSTKEEFLKHLVETHSKDVLSVFANVVPRKGKDHSVFDDPDAEIKNSFGRKSRLGESGKFYCAGPLHVCGWWCNDNACDPGCCGPNEGLNCLACMRLDIAKRKLPQGCLVNKRGCIATRSKQDGKFYCERQVSKIFKCEIIAGKNCFDCQKLDAAIKGPSGRYVDLV